MSLPVLADFPGRWPALIGQRGRLRLGATSGGNSRGGVSLCWRSGSGWVSGMVISSACS
jgi:hypothetical protein